MIARFVLTPAAVAVAAVLATSARATAAEAPSKGSVLDPADLSVPGPTRKSKGAPAVPAPIPAASAPAGQGAAASQGAPVYARTWGGSFSLNFPHPFFFELEHRFGPRWTGGIGLGGVSLNEVNINGGPVSANMVAVDARARWHPWEGAFFAGVAAGLQKFDAAAVATYHVTVTSPSGSQATDVITAVTANLTSVYLTPHVGWFKVFDNGFLLGFELGVQLPLSVRKTLDIDPQSQDPTTLTNSDIQGNKQFQSDSAQVQDAVDTFGKTPLPYVTAVRLGWMF